MQPTQNISGDEETHLKRTSEEFATRTRLHGVNVLKLFAYRTNKINTIFI